MCRIRAIEARTRSTRGEAVVAGRAGGMNLGFFLDPTSMTDSGVVLMDARKGEKDEHVLNIISWRQKIQLTPTSAYQCAPM